MTTNIASIEVPVLARWSGSGWSLTYLWPCVECGARHRHGGGSDPFSPRLGTGAWGSHCGSGHRVYGPNCVEGRDHSGRARCAIVHTHMVTLRHANANELALLDHDTLLTYAREHPMYNEVGDLRDLVDAFEESMA